MKKVFLSIALTVLTITAFGQKIYQSGAYKSQKLRSSQKLEGILIEKYGHNRFMWFRMAVNGQETIVSIVDIDVYCLAKRGERLILDGCFPLESEKWRRKNSDTATYAK